MNSLHHKATMTTIISSSSRCTPN